MGINVQNLDSILEMTLAKDYTSISYAIMQHGQILAASALGTSGTKEKKPSTINDTYNVASVSKIYCTLAVMKLVEQKKVDLDTPICKYLPKFKMLDERYKEITLRHCLNHSSGLPGTMWKHFSATDVTSGGYYDLVYDYMSKNYLKAAPGAYSTYCNDGFTMAELVVAEVSGQSFDAFCRQYITGPLGADTTQLACELTGEHTLTKESGKPYELLYIQGGAGFTTSMTDLCKMGNMILHPEGYFEQSSIDEMAKKQGISFIPEDTRSGDFGLGWDNVNFADPDYDLGEGVLRKSGNSFQFTTQFFVIPKYDAVLAISETHDCKIDVAEAILRLFSVVMQEQGINIMTNGRKLVPEAMKEEFAGKYAFPSSVLNLHLYGAEATAVMEGTDGTRLPVFKNLKYNGEYFTDENGGQFYFTKANGMTFLMNIHKGVHIPMAQKITDLPAITEKWKKRIGKQYVCITTSPYDLVIHELMTGFKMYQLQGYEGVMLASFAGKDDSGVYGLFDACVKEVDADRATGFLQTPANGSRDLITLNYEVVDGVEYCHTASYTYQEVESLEVYRGELFHQRGDRNRVYKINSRLEHLPEVPNGRRLLILDENLGIVYDSLYESDYKPVETGYISFI